MLRKRIGRLPADLPACVFAATLARTQVLLTQGGRRTAECEEIIRDELLSVGVGDGEDVALDGREVELDRTTGEAPGMAPHELTINALKCGAFGRRAHHSISTATLI